MAYEVTEITGTAQTGITERRYTRVWRVVSDEDVILHPASVINLVPVAAGDLFPYDFLAKARSVNADYEDVASSRRVVLVTASYETGSGGKEKIENENPLLDRPDIRWGSRTVRLPVRFTDDDPPMPIQNSAGQLFDPLPEEDFQVLVYEFAHNIATYNEAQASEYRGAINEDSFTLAGLELEPFQARIQAIEATNQERNGIRYWRESIVVEIVDDWRLQLIDEGVMKKTTTNEVGPGDPHYIGGGEDFVTPILDANGNPIFEPTLLDGQGNPLGAGDPVLLVFNTRAKPRKTFGNLGLPIDNNP